MSKKITITIDVTWNDAIAKAYPEADDPIDALRDDVAAEVWEHIGEGMFCSPSLPKSISDQLAMEIIEDCTVQIDEYEYPDPGEGAEEDGVCSASLDRSVNE